MCFSKSAVFFYFLTNGESRHPRVENCVMNFSPQVVLIYAFTAFNDRNKDIIVCFSKKCSVFSFPDKQTSNVMDGQLQN